MEIKGIDVSSLQGNPTWKKVAASGVKFAILRVHQLYGIDSSFERNYKKCKENGILVGGYKFSYALTTQQALEEAESTIDVLAGKKLDFPLFYDLEWKNQRALGKTAITQITKVFLERVRDAGYIPGIYCNVDWYNNVLDVTNLKYDYWLASYPTKENDTGIIQERLRPLVGVGWQYSSKGRVPGINGEVDMDVFYDDYSEKGDKENMSVKNIIESAVNWMEQAAYDNSHGYDQIYRWGEKGDYDCSSAVITAWQSAGVPVKSNGATYTGNMLSVFKKCGFQDITSSINLSTGSGLVRGDVLLNTVHHTAMYCGGGYEVEASINEKGTATGGTPGDQTGKEFLKRTYRNYPWTNVLRYTGGETTGIETWAAIGTAISTVDNLYVRSEPNGMVLGELMKGNRFEIDGKTFGNWTHVKVSGIGVGYVYTKYIQKDGQVNTNTKISGKQNKGERLFVGKVKSDGVNVRTWAGSSYPRIKSYPTLNKGNLVDVMNYTQKDIDGVDWYYVRIAGKYYGFVKSSYIKKQ